MIELIQCLIVLVITIFLFFLFGKNFNYLTKIRNNILETIGIGFFLYYGMFQLVALPCIFTKQSLTLLSVLWGVIILGMIVLFVYYKKKESAILPLKYNINECIPWIKNHKIVILVVILALLQCYIAAASTYVGWDTAYYIGVINTSVYTDTMYIYNGTGGLPEKYIPFRYALSGFYMNSAVWCKWFHVEPILLQRYIICTICQLMTNLFACFIAKEVFKEIKKVALFMCFFIMCNFLFITDYTSAAFLLNRGYEAKAFCANVLILATIYGYMILRKDIQDKRNWYMFGIIVSASIPISMSAIVLIPVLVVVLMVMLFYEKRNIIILKNGILCLIPNVIYAVIYFLHTLDVIIIR